MDLFKYNSDRMVETLINTTESSNYMPTSSATINPTSSATINPTSSATINPTSSATVNPTSSATINPTSSATVNPTSSATVNPTSRTDSITISSINTMQSIAPTTQVSYPTDVTRSTILNDTISFDTNSMNTFYPIATTSTTRSFASEPTTPNMLLPVSATTSTTRSTILNDMNSFDINSMNTFYPIAPASTTRSVASELTTTGITSFASELTTTDMSSSEDSNCNGIVIPLIILLLLLFINWKH
jgi:hypothetical protein